MDEYSSCVKATLQRLLGSVKTRDSLGCAEPGRATPKNSSRLVIVFDECCVLWRVRADIVMLASFNFVLLWS